MSTSNNSISYWDSIGKRAIRLVNLHPSESSQEEEEDSESLLLNLSGMHHRNDENRGKRRSDKVGHVVETRSRTRASFSSPNSAQKSVSNTPSPAINGFHDDEEGHGKPFAIPKISPRKLKELRELNEMSTWKDPAAGKHPRPTRKSLQSQRTSPRMPALKSAPQSSTPNVFPIRPSTRSQVKQNGFDVNGLRDSSPEPSFAAALLNGVIKKRRRSSHFRENGIHEPSPKKQRISKLKIKIAKRISRIKKRPVKLAKFKPYKTRNVLAFEAEDFENPKNFESRETLRMNCMKRKLPPKKSRGNKFVQKFIKKNPLIDTESTYSIIPKALATCKVDEVKVAKSVLPVLAYAHRKLPSVSLVEKTYIKRVLRLKRPRDAGFLLPFARRRLKNNSKLKIATKRVKLPPLRNGIKWMALLTPCQRSCNCMKFETRRVKWDSKIPREEDVAALRTDETCSGCRHSLWVHRRKYDVEERRKRYTVLRDIIICQKMMEVESNKEKLRVLFILLKDLMSIIIENLPIPKECFPYKNSLTHDLSIRRHIQAFMQTKEARRLGFLNRHAQDLLQTLEEFTFPTPDQIEQYSYSFKFKKYSGTVVEKTFLTWYRHFYLRWLIFCRLPYFLSSLPKYETCNIMSFQFVDLFAEEISLKLEEKYAETKDSGVKVVAVMFRRLRVFARSVVTINTKTFKKLAMRGCGNNVLEKDYVSLPQSPDAMETRNTPALEAILQEPSGPFTFIQHFEEDSQPLEVSCPLPYAKYFWRLAKKKKYKLFLNDPNNGPKNQKELRLRHDPNTLSAMEEISNDMHKIMRVSRWRSNCDKERAAGKIEMLVLRNIKSTTCPMQSEFLNQFIAVIHRQLPKMPKHYIIRLVMDGKHRSMILLKYLNRGSCPGWNVLGGICFRPFKTQSFSEIVFVAVHADHQVRGYGGYLMDQLKRYHVEHLGFPHLLTFADQNATGYFEKQGFSFDIGLSREHYFRYIKEYEGARLMYCQSRLCNTPEDEYYWAFKLAKHLRNLYEELCPEWSQIHDGLGKKFVERDLLPMKLDRFEQVDNYNLGLCCNDIALPPLFWKRQYELIEMGGGPEEEEEFSTDDEIYGNVINPFEESTDEEDDYTMEDEIATPDWKEPDDDYDPDEEDMTQMMFMLVEAIFRCPYSWPFVYPVDEYDAPTYTEEISQPMTLEIIEDRLEWGYYIHERMLFLDFARIFLNCYAFNEQLDGPYYHACYRLHQYFNALSLQIFGERIAQYLLPIAEASTLRVPGEPAEQVVFDPLRPYWYPVRLALPPPPPSPKTKKTPKKKSSSKNRNKSIGPSTSKKNRQKTKSQTPVRERTPQPRKASFTTPRKVQTKLVFNQSSSSGFHLELLDETPSEKRTTRAAASKITPNNKNARRRKR